MKSKDSTTNFVLKCIGEDGINEIDNYVEQMCTENFKVFNNGEEVDDYFFNYLDELKRNLTYEDINNIKDYTNRCYSRINDLLRNKWNYEINGRLTETDKQEYRQLASDIDQIIKNSPIIPENLVVFRGVNINAFYDFGINNLDSLVEMKNQYMYQQGFTSTSLVQESSLSGQNNWYGNINISMKIMIPKDNNEGMILGSNNSVYSEEKEYLITAGTLIKILDVNVIGNEAKITAMYIPKRIWDRNYIPVESNTQNL